jgi:murein DD-endopeptidase MepM/ murein hydrolase activator NlpD
MGCMRAALQEDEMSKPTVQSLPESLTVDQQNALAILSNLELDDFNQLKTILRVGAPGVIGPQTLAEFLSLCARVRLDLSLNGVNSFKDAHQLGNTGPQHGVIGPQTAEIYYHTVLSLLDRTAMADGSFPFSLLPSADWTHGARAFASNRSQGTRAHAGCDLYFPVGTWIHAIRDGVVTAGPYAFYAGTFALEVDHGSFLARYGEIQASAPVSAGDHVTGGQKIARVGHLIGITVPSDMLHLELYDKSDGASGPLTVGAAHSKRRADGVPFLRRKDLTDPTPSLNIWKNNLPQG